LAGTTASRLLRGLAPEDRTRDPEQSAAQVETIVVREAGYLKGGLKRRLITRIQFAPGALP